MSENAQRGIIYALFNYHYPANAMNRLLAALLLSAAATAHAAPKVDLDRYVRLLECRPTTADMKIDADSGLPALGDNHPLVKSHQAMRSAIRLPKPITANGMTSDLIYAGGGAVQMLIPSKAPAADIMAKAREFKMSTENFSKEYPVYSFTLPRPSKERDVNGRPLSEMRLSVSQGWDGVEQDKYYLLGCEF
ncbi:hypothetical protein [Chitinilyticum aquatile]|uniref:hypothetical protein n=1 Tax=Chitinilyticum aquatile TaxID=362520 RepID=UPI0003F9CC89|nr:hypothetical protein [Chitinilyticum aquatile]